MMLVTGMTRMTCRSMDLAQETTKPQSQRIPLVLMGVVKIHNNLPLVSAIR